MEENLYALGVDLDHSLSFHDGDIKLISYEDNLIQAIQNRLNTQIDELNYMYEDYGSLIRNFLGWRPTDETLSLIKTELNTTLNEDLRILSWTSDISYEGNGKLRIDVTLNPTNGSTINATFLMDETGIEVI